MNMYDPAETAAFTGHRPKNLPFGYNDHNEDGEWLRSMLQNEIRSAAIYGYRYFMSGMALGADLIAAEEVITMKRREFPNIHLIAVIPCSGQIKRWGEDQTERYERLLTLARQVEYTHEGTYFQGCMQKRNRYMINNSSLLIATCDGSPGGTLSTLELAKDKGSVVAVVDPRRKTRTLLLENERQWDYYDSTKNNCEEKLNELYIECPEYIGRIAAFSEEKSVAEKFWLCQRLREMLPGQC